MLTDDAIRQRKTVKLLADRDLPVKDIRATVDELLELAGMAPFHRACEQRHREKGLPGIEPWRFHVLDAAACRRLHPRLPKENAGKIPAMLAAADALILATWLPNADPTATTAQGPTFAVNLPNVEHIAATAAAIENLLLAATARGLSTYWSSGGEVLRTQATFELLGIPTDQLLLGAIFLFPSEIGDAELATSRLRSQRTPYTSWSRWIEL